MHRFRIYITGQNPISNKAVEDLDQILSSKLANQYSLEIVDILEHPQMAEEDDILATPSIVKLNPLPRRRIVGSLNDQEKILLALGLTEKEF